MEPEQAPRNEPGTSTEKNRVAPLFILGTILLVAIAGSAFAYYKKGVGQDGSVAVNSAATPAITATTSPSPSTAAVASASPTATATTASSTVTTAPCGYTRTTTEGPYYVTGTSELTNGNLNYDNLEGQSTTVSGHVYSGLDTSTPLASAKLEIWQADDSGNYHPQANGAASKYSTDQLSLRGYVMTDANGAYSFNTIFPGEYSGRSRHFHLRATSGSTSVITQLVFFLDGDKQSLASDQIATTLADCQKPEIDTSDSTWKISYDFFLR